MDSDQSAHGTEVNRLYWETDVPVAEIAQRLDISRRALYDVIRPIPASGHCSACGGELEFANRSTRAHGIATCRSCGQESSAEPEPAWTWSPDARAITPTRPVPPPRSVWWLGAAALAAALGAAAVTLLIIRDE